METLHRVADNQSRVSDRRATSLTDSTTIALQIFVHEISYLR
jgi:hypothetical protein